MPCLLQCCCNALSFQYPCQVRNNEIRRRVVAPPFSVWSLSSAAIPLLCDFVTLTERLLLLLLLLPCVDSLEIEFLHSGSRSRSSSLYFLWIFSSSSPFDLQLPFSEWDLSAQAAIAATAGESKDKTLARNIALPV